MATFAELQKGMVEACQKGDAEAIKVLAAQMARTEEVKGVGAAVKAREEAETKEQMAKLEKLSTELYSEITNRCKGLLASLAELGALGFAYRLPERVPGGVVYKSCEVLMPKAAKKTGNGTGPQGEHEKDGPATLELLDLIKGKVSSEELAKLTTEMVAAKALPKGSSERKNTLYQNRMNVLKVAVRIGIPGCKLAG